MELLPNEIFVECFQYLNGPDIFNSFDRLNSRFSQLIRNILLHLNCSQMKKIVFNQFCEIILLNPEIKQKITYLQISNNGTCNQIENFLSLLPLNDFINLRSLSLIEIKNENLEQLLPMLSFLLNLYSFSFTYTNFQTKHFQPFTIMSALSKSKLRILSVPYFDFNSISIYHPIAVTSLTIMRYDLDQLFKYTPMLKYLKIENFTNHMIMSNQWNISNENAVYLKELIIDDCTVSFQHLELLLKCIPNLKIFSITNSDDRNMFDAIRWQNLIESSLKHLLVFKFNFTYYDQNDPKVKLNEIQRFQTDFWQKQHDWYINYEIHHHQSTIYTIPYVQNSYALTPKIDKCDDLLTKNSNIFDNVKKLCLYVPAITNDSPYYFRNVESLVLMDVMSDDDEINEKELKVTQIKFINLSNIKQLKISDECHITSSVFLDLLKELPYVSSLTIDEFTLIKYLENVELCKYYNEKINCLDITCDCDWGDGMFHPTGINLLFCQVFSNLEQLRCHYLEKVDDLLLILTLCTKLSIIKPRRISKSIRSWIEVNASKLNVYIDLSSYAAYYDT